MPKVHVEQVPVLQAVLVREPTDPAKRYLTLALPEGSVAVMLAEPATTTLCTLPSQATVEGVGTIGPVLVRVRVADGAELAMVHWMGRVAEV